MTLDEFRPLEPCMRIKPALLKTLAPGSVVRLQLRSGSRFWCRVTEPRRPNGIHVGIADDTVDPVKRGDLVYFERRHVFDVV